MRTLLFVTTGLAYGGAETQLKELAIRLKQRGWEVHIASMLPPTAYVEDLESVGIPVYNLRMRRKVPDPRAIFRLVSIIRTTCPLVVHAHMIHANLLSRIVRLTAKTPTLICTAHNIIEGGCLREIAYRVTDPLSDMTTQVSLAGLERYIRVGAAPKHKIIFIPNGIDTARFCPDANARQSLRRSLGVEDAFVWLTVGRLEPVKNHFGLIEAWRQVVCSNPQSVLLIVGQGPLHDQISQHVQQEKLETSVRLLGLRRDIPDLMRAADGFVLPSLWEGMPLVLLEASASGLPIVATNVGGNAEVVLDGVSGFLVPPQNSARLAEAMQRVMALPEPQRRAMGEAGRQHILANYDIERIVDRWETLYTELLAKKGIHL